MSRKHRRSIVPAALLVASFVAAALADEPEAVLDREGGTFGVGLFDAGPHGDGIDELYAKSTRGRIRATYAYVLAGGADDLEIRYNAGSADTRINAATVRGRDSSQAVLLAVAGVFVPDPPAAGSGGPAGTGGSGGASAPAPTWTAHYANQSDAPEVHLWAGEYPGPRQPYLVCGATLDVQVVLLGFDPQDTSAEYVVTLAKTGGDGEVEFVGPAALTFRYDEAAGAWRSRGTCTLRGTSCGQVELAASCPSAAGGSETVWVVAQPDDRFDIVCFYAPDAADAAVKGSADSPALVVLTPETLEGHEVYQVPADLRCLGLSDPAQLRPPQVSLTFRVPLLTADVWATEAAPGAGDVQPGRLYVWCRKLDGGEATVSCEELKPVGTTHKVATVCLTMPTTPGKRFQVRACCRVGGEVQQQAGEIYEVAAGAPATLQVWVPGDAGAWWEDLVRLYTPQADEPPEARDLGVRIFAAASAEQGEAAVQIRLLDAFDNPVAEGTPVGCHYRPKPGSFWDRIGPWRHTTRAGVDRARTDVVSREGGRASLLLCGAAAGNDPEVLLLIQAGAVQACIGDPLLAVEAGLVEGSKQFDRLNNTGSFRAVVTCHGLPLKNTDVWCVATKGSLRRADDENWVYGSVKVRTDDEGRTGTVHFTNRYFDEGLYQENQYIRPALGPFTIWVKAGESLIPVLEDKYYVPAVVKPVIFMNDPALIANADPSSPTVTMEITRLDVDRQTKAVAGLKTDSITTQSNGVVYLPVHESIANQGNGAVVSFRFHDPHNDELLNAGPDQMTSYAATDWAFDPAGETQSEAAPNDVCFGRHVQVGTVSPDDFLEVGGEQYLRKASRFEPQRSVVGVGSAALYVPMWEETHTFQVLYRVGCRDWSLWPGTATIAEVDFTDPDLVDERFRGMRIRLAMQYKTSGDCNLLAEVERGRADGTEMDTQWEWEVEWIGGSAGVLTGDILDIRWQYNVAYSPPPSYDCVKIVKWTVWVRNQRTGQVCTVAKADYFPLAPEMWPLPVYRFSGELSLGSWVDRAGVARPRHHFNSGVGLSRLAPGGARVNGFIGKPDTAAPDALGIGDAQHKVKVASFRVGVSEPWDDSHWVRQCEDIDTDGDGTPDELGVPLGWVNAGLPGDDPEVQRSIWQRQVMMAAIAFDHNVLYAVAHYPVTCKQMLAEFYGVFKALLWEDDERFEGGRVGEFIGGMLIVGDIGRIIKQLSRLAGSPPDKPFNKWELGFSCAGVILAVLPGLGEGVRGSMEALMKAMRKELAATALIQGAVCNLALGYIVEHAAAGIVRAIMIWSGDAEEDGAFGWQDLPPVDGY